MRKKNFHARQPVNVPRVFIAMAWRNLWRNPLRSILTMAALAGGMMVLILYAALMKGMTQQMIAFATEVSTGHLQVHRAGFYQDRDVYATMPKAWIPELEARFPELVFTPRAYGAGLISSDHASLGASIQGVVVAKEKATTKFLTHLEKGTFDEARASPYPSVAIGHHLADQLAVDLGDEIVLMTQAMDGSIGHDLYHVGAVFKPISPAFDRNGVVMRFSDFENLMALSGGFHEVIVRTPSPSDVADTAQRLAQYLPALMKRIPLADDFGGQPQVRTWQALVPMVKEMLDLSGAMMVIVGAVLAGLAALGMLNTLLMAMHERRYELGILRAIGMRPLSLCSLVMFEVLLLAGVAVIIGAALGVLVTLYVGQTGIDFSAALPDGFDWGGMVFEPVMAVELDTRMILPAAFFMILITVIAVLLPVQRSLRGSPVELLR